MSPPSHPPLCLEGLSGSWKDNGSAGPFTPSSNSSSGGYWSWSAPSDQSNPSTPSPPLSADSFKPFRVPSLGGVGNGTAGPEDPSLDDQDGSSLLFDEPIPRKRKMASPPLPVPKWADRIGPTGPLRPAPWSSMKLQRRRLQSQDRTPLTALLGP
ncbi:hypothetical protein NQZ68_001888 [Dissostichus eleginoides]|nr:hypothetical protein NQZ68_001888 [Dissostichus eleginoides]